MEEKRKRLSLCLGILCGYVDNLEKDDLVLLGMGDTPYPSLYKHPTDYCWRGQVTPEGSHPIDYRVEPRDILARCITTLTEIILPKVGRKV